MELTIEAAKEELFKGQEARQVALMITVLVIGPFIYLHSHRTAKWITRAQNIALTLEILIGALTTALGAALNSDSVHCINLCHPLARLISMPDKNRDLGPWGFLDACSVVPGANEGIG